MNDVYMAFTVYTIHTRPLICQTTIVPAARWQLSTARPAEALLSQLRGLWQHGTPGEAVAACGAAAGLAAAGQLGEAQLSEVVKDMLALVKRPRWVGSCKYGFSARTAQGGTPSWTI